MDFILVLPSIYINFDIQTGGRGTRTQIRETSLEEGKVVVKVWDKASKNFAIKAVNKGGQYKAVAQEGRLRMAFTVTALVADTPPESLMALLLRQNPGLPSGPYCLYLG